MAGFIVSLMRYVQLVEEPNGQLTIIRGNDRISMMNLSSAVATAIRDIAKASATEDDLAARILESDGFDGLTEFYEYLGSMCERRMIAYLATVDGCIVATCIPHSARFEFSTNRRTANERVVLSRFAFLRREGNDWVLESPESLCCVLFHDANSISILARYASPCVSDDTPLFDLLSGTGFLVAQEDSDSSLAPWEFHDLLFHSRSRAGRHANPYGRVVRGPEKSIERMTVKPPMSAECIGLYRPENVSATEFGRIVEARRSIRHHGVTPITSRQLGEFLYRSARVSNCETGARVYPTGGASYELEVYPVVDRCDGLASGLYQYDAHEHRLFRIAGRTPEVDALLASAARTARTETPQVLLVIASRFQRIMSKYSSVSYSLILKDVGVLFQTMYLVATSMGLAPCALGGGNSDVFAAASGLDYFTEGSVGEFMIGSIGNENGSPKAL